MKYVEIYTDGACRGNPGPGAWCALLRYSGHEKIITGVDPITTNNRMELMAAIQALRSLNQICEIDLHTDSEYLRKGMTEWLIQWKKRHWYTSGKKPIKNLDLWQALEQVAVKHKISWHWVKGHSGHPENDLVDTKANQALDDFLKGNS
jgi:ribonuclease HI